jgi:hypothetical protein
MKTYDIKMTVAKNGFPGELLIEVYGPNDRWWFTFNYTASRIPRTIDWSRAFERRMTAFLEQE